MKEKDSLNEELIAALLEHHRFYVNRNWNFFGGILLVNSIIFNSIDKILADYTLLSGLAISAILVIGVFYHLINWTDLRIEMNMEKVNELMKKYKTPFPKSVFEGMINWMKFAIFILTIPYFFFLNRVNLILLICGIVIFLIMLLISEVVTRKFKKKHKKTTVHKTSILST